MNLEGVVWPRMYTGPNLVLMALLAELRVDVGAAEGYAGGGYFRRRLDQRFGLPRSDVCDDGIEFFFAQLTAIGRAKRRHAGRRLALRDDGAQRGIIARL